MNEELLKLGYSKLDTKKSYDEYKSDMQENEDLRKLVFSKLETEKSYDTFVEDLGFDLGKPEAVQDAAPVTAEVEAAGTESILEDGLLEFPIEGSLSLDNELQPEYLINDKKVKRSDLNDKLYDSDFIEGIQDGKINVSVKNDPKIMDLLERQANSGSQWGDKIEAFNSGLATLASGITGVQSYIEDVITEITGLEPTGMALLQKRARDQVSESLAKKAEDLNNQQRAYKEDFIGSISEGNVLDAVNIGFNTVANSAPMMVAAGLTGGAGGVAGSLTSAATMSGIMIPAEYASTKISEDEKIKELSDGDKLTRAFFRGGAEGVFEGLMGPVGARSFSLFKDGVKNLVKTAAKEGGVEAAKEVAEGMGKKTALEVFKTFGISTAGEGGSEALTALSQDLTDDYLGIQNLSVEEYMRNAAEAGALGIFMGGVTTGALGGAGQVMSYLPLRNQKVYQGAKTEVRDKQESGEINNEEAKQMDDAIESAKVALDKTDPSLSEENQEKVAKLIDERERIKIEIEGLDDNQVPVQNKKNRIEEINKEISEIGIEKPSTEEETGVPPTPEEPASVETAPAEEVSEAPYDIEEYNKAMEEGFVDNDLIEELKDEEINRAYETRETERKILETELNKDGEGGLFSFLHENLGRITPKDFDDYGDANLRKGDKSFSIKFLSKKAIPLDMNVQELSEIYGTEITPQDAIDYIIDRQANPEKYTRSKSKLSALNRAAKIKGATPGEAFDIYSNLDGSEASMKAIDDITGTVLSDEQAVIIKNYLKIKEDGKKTDSRASKSIQQPDDAATESAETETAEVEKLRAEEQAEISQEEKIKIAEKIGRTRKVKAKNVSGLIDVMAGIFGLNKNQAESAAIVGDVIIGNAAKRAGISKDEMYQNIAFQKANEKDLPQGVKFQVDAFHGSPYQFDKFELSKIGTGEGAQAFGWGLYFTDLESIARNYADKLTQTKVIVDGKAVDRKEDFFLYKAAYDIANLGYERAVERNKELVSEGDSDAKAILNAIEGLKGKDVKFGKDANVYKVSLHKGKTPDQYAWLEWDKAVGEKVETDIIGAVSKKIFPENRYEIKEVGGKYYILDKIKDESISSGYTTIDKARQNIENLKYFNERSVKKLRSNDAKTFYEALSGILGGDKQASLFLLENGIDGIKYPAESISRGATSDTARGFNYVVFDENAVSIEEVIKFQKDVIAARGAMMMAMDNQAIIYALTDPNVSTPLHELAHVYEHYLTDAERKQIEKWSGHKSGTVEFSEAFARGFEKFLANGKVNNPKLQKIFESFKQWLTDIYNGIKGSDIDVKLNDEMRSIYDQMLSEEVAEEKEKSKLKETTKAAPKARSVASETTGLSPREAFKQGFTEFFDAIQRGKKEARQKAAENLKEKLNKVRESFKKKLQKEKDNKTARAAVVKEIRAIIKDSGISQFSKRTINKIMTNVKNTNVSNMQRMVDEVMDVVNRDIDRKVRAARYKTLKAAIKKLSRLGALKELQKPLMEVLSINPDYLSKTALRFYDKVVVDLANVEKKFDSRDSREDLKNAAEEVIKRFTNDNIRAEELAEKTINPNLDLTKTKGENLKQMLKDGLISDSDFELMTRFKDLIGSTTKEGLTLEELEQKAKERRDNAIEDFEAAMDEIPSSLPNLSKDDAEAVRFANGLKMKDLESLSTAQIKMLTRGLEMLQAGFVTTNLVQSKIRVEAKREVTNTLISETEERGKIDSAISKAKVFVKNLFRKRDKMITSIENRIKSTPLTNIDQILNAGAKKFKSTRIYESIFRPAGAAFSKTEDFLKQVKKKLQVADSILDININKRYVQKAKVMIYQIQREFESNPKNNEVTEAIEWIEATLNDAESNISDKERKAIEKIRDEFTVNGQIDSKKILDSLTSKEKKYMAIVDEVYKSVEFMVAADAKMQGKPFVLRENYVHLPKVTKSGNSMSSDLEAISNSFTNPALKNKALTQRTGNAHAISFDPTFNVNGITKKAAISYYMYPAVKKAKITLAGVKQNADTNFQKETADALESVFDGIVKSQYAHLSREKAFIEKALAFLGRAGYLAQLAGPVKAAVELSTNLTHALFVNPTGLISGFDTLSGNSREIMDAAINNLPTNQLNRLSGEGVKDSKEIDSRLINDSLNVFEQEEMTSEFRAKVNTIFKFAKKPASAIIKFNESLISRPDTIVARPLFVGVFNKSFENIAQEKPNWDKIANDQAYRDKFREAINQATEDADAAVVDNAASNNPFDGIPKNVLDKDATPTKQALQMVDRYMTRFRTFEYYSALKGIQGLMGKGKLTPTQGAMLLAGTVVRLSLYKMGIDMAFTLIFSMLGIDEEEDEIDLEKDLAKGVLGAVATLALGRSFGNISQMPINYGTEWLNKEYGEGITRSGEYNQYKDGMVFSKIPQEVKPQDNMVEKIVTSSLGSYTPMVKTLTRAGKLATRAETLKTEEARDRNFGELTTRIPFEIAGNLGVIPGYKSLRKIYNQYLFEAVNKNKSKESERTDTRRTDTRRSSRRDTRRSSRREN